MRLNRGWGVGIDVPVFFGDSFHITKTKISLGDEKKPLDWLGDVFLGTSIPIPVERDTVIQRNWYASIWPFGSNCQREGRAT